MKIGMCSTLSLARTSITRELSFFQRLNILRVLLNTSSPTYSECDEDWLELFSNEKVAVDAYKDKA
jgi:hypothetical protein